jgi:putative intracellular protease/amidase
MAPPLVYGVVLFPGFQLLDVAGPLDICNLLRRDYPELKLYILSSSLEPVYTQQGASFDQGWVPTHTFGDCPSDIEVLLVPGGMGVRDEKIVQEARAFVKEIYPKLRYLITVCTGSALVARVGVLDGKKATSNKASFGWVCPTCRRFQQNTDQGCKLGENARSQRHVDT